MINDLLSLLLGIIDYCFIVFMCVIGLLFFFNGFCGKGRKENCFVMMILMGG